MQIPDITKLTWSLNVALVGAIFSVFSMIYNEHFIYYGFITFTYGIVAHQIAMIYDYWFSETSPLRKPFFFITEIILTIVWILIILKIY